jgi:ribonuclease E
MSRQRLRPSLDEASHVICPRCNGQGTIRNIESLALSVLRLIQEEAMKDKTGRVMVQLPVKVATFLLNEKRDAIRAIEQRHRVGVMLIPNESLETPHFKLNRLRMDELSDAQLLSYSLAEDFEEQYETQASAAAREAGEEPAVKGVAPASPAPPPPAPAPKPETSVSFFRWLWGNLFGQPLQQSREERPVKPGTRPAKPERRHRDRPGRRVEAESATEAPVAPVPAAILPAVEESRPEPKPVESAMAPGAEIEELAATTEAEEETSNTRNRRGRRGGRRRRRGETSASAEATDVTEAAEAAGQRMESADRDRTEPGAAEPSPAPEPTAAATPLPQRRIRSGRPRLPREMLAAGKATSIIAELPEAPNEPPVPPPPSLLEYPDIEEGAEPAVKALESVEVTAESAETVAFAVETAETVVADAEPAKVATVDAEPALEPVVTEVALEPVVPATAELDQTIAAETAETSEPVAPVLPAEPAVDTSVPAETVPTPPEPETDTEFKPAG